MAEIEGFGDLSDISPTDFAKLVKTAPKEVFEQVLGDPEARTTVLDEVFNRMTTLYKGSKSTKAVLHWKILDKPGGGYDLYETVLDGTECTVNKDGENEARATISLNGVEFLKLASGNASPPVQFMTGKIKIKGDLGFAAGLASLFNIPKA
ncbi:SCP2 sterol-binding domain-containing protein [Longispora albida]|uniref:SCP2 sterol-binding domain-containing protein n=1 Tax=Longispora albida TaxID=203523 RepID=UPI0003683A20|nr:SCP2 sterol-binding domain-containing protein [Longispora albida]